MKPLEEATDASDYGSLVHDGLHRFLRRHGATWPNDAARELRLAMAQALAEAGLRQALRAWWSPRLDRIADWVAQTETERRTARAPVTIATEVAGAIELLRPGGKFRLTGRADRIERYADGTLSILDYKTGSPPTQKEVDAGLAPQLLLEAAMAADRGFGAGPGGRDRRTDLLAPVGRPGSRPNDAAVQEERRPASPTPCWMPRTGCAT